MRFVPKIRRFSVRTRLTVAVLAVIVFSWLMGLVTFRYYMEQDLKRFNQEWAARDANNRLRLEGPMGRLSLAPRGEGRAAVGKWPEKVGGPPPGASVNGPIGPGPGPGPGPGGPGGPGDHRGPGGPGGPGHVPRPLSLSMITQAVTGVLMALLAGWWLSRRFTRPLAALAEGARAFHHSQFQHRIPVIGNDEFSDVAAAMNEMADRVGAQITALEEDARRRQQILADVAHELRSPVATMEAMAAALQDGLAEQPARRAEALSFIRDSSSRMRRLVNDLLEVARLDLHEVPLLCAPVDLRDLAEDAVASHQPAAAAAGIVLHPAEVGEPVMVDADSLRIAQVVDNLVENAISYAGPGAEIHVRVSPNPPSITVDDTGAGIAARHLPFVFDPFYRADVARTPGDNHSGLGLRISRGLVEAHGGTLTLESEEGKGARAIVTLPAPSVIR